MAAAHERRPNNPVLRDIAAALGLTIIGPRLDNPTGKPFESIIQENAKSINFATFVQELPILAGWVYWVDIPGGGGTGFLVGPDLIMTNYHVIDPVIQGKAKWQDVRCRFDYKQAINGPASN